MMAPLSGLLFGIHLARYGLDRLRNWLFTKIMLFGIVSLTKSNFNDDLFRKTTNNRTPSHFLPSIDSPIHFSLAIELTYSSFIAKSAFFSHMSTMNSTINPKNLNQSVQNQQNRCKSLPSPPLSKFTRERIIIILLIN